MLVVGMSRMMRMDEVKEGGEVDFAVGRMLVPFVVEVLRVQFVDGQTSLVVVQVVAIRRVLVEDVLDVVDGQNVSSAVGVVVV